MGKEEGQSILPEVEHAWVPRWPWEAQRGPLGGRSKNHTKLALERAHAAAAQKHDAHKLS